MQLRKRSRPFGTFRWRDNAIYLDYRVFGRRQRPFFATARTNSKAERQNLETEARRRLNEIEMQERGGQLLEISKYPKYIQIAEFFWEQCLRLKPYFEHDRSSQASEYAKMQHGVRFFEGKHADEITRAEIKQFRMHLAATGKKAKRPWGQAYINRLVSMVGQVYHYAINQETWIFKNAPAREVLKYGNIDLCVNLTNPTHGLSKLTELKVTRIIPSFEQFQDFIKRLKRPEFRAMAIVGVHTGLRRRNVVRLKWSEVDCFNWRIMPESTKANDCPTGKQLHAEAIDAIRSVMDSRSRGEFVFSKPNGDPYVDFRMSWNKAAKAAGIAGFTFSDLRPTYASWRVEEGVAMPLLQRALDHTTPATTGQHYNRTERATDEILKTQRAIFAA